MASDRQECYNDALKNLAECHKQAHEVYLGALMQIHSTTYDSDDARDAAIKQAKDNLLHAYDICEEAHKGEKEACDREYPVH
jgi:hypothetical protein